MNVIEISTQEYLERIDKPFNPPGADIPEEAFDREYYALYDLVEPLMASHGENDAYGQGDYYLEASIARSRGLGMEITNPAIITHKLIKELQGILAVHAPNWEIYLGSGEFDYGTFIGLSEVRVQRNTSELLKQLFE